MNIESLCTGEYAFLSTDQGGKFKIAHESIKDLTRHAIISFTPDGITLLAQDTASFVEIEYQIPRQKILDTGGLYNCTSQCIKVGIDTKQFAQNLKSIPSSDIWSIGVNARDTSVLYMFRINKKAKWTSCMELRTKIVEDVPMYHPISVYRCMVICDSNMFHETLRDFNLTDSPTTRVYCDGERLVFSAQGDFNSMNVEIANNSVTTTTPTQDLTPETTKKSHKRQRVEEPAAAVAEAATTSDAGTESDDEDCEDERQAPAEDNHQRQQVRQNLGMCVYDLNAGAPSASGEQQWPICDTYTLKSLQRATKSKGFSPSVKIYLRRHLPNGFPIALSYENNIGTLRFFITPVNDETWVPYEERTMPCSIGGESCSAAPSTQTATIVTVKKP